jgi:hypothetical protein
MGVRLTHYAFDEARISDELGLLRTTSAYEIREALAVLAPRRGQVCRLLSNGHRRWWIGGVAHALRTHSSLVRGLDVSEVERTLAAILRRYDCGGSLAPARPAAPFPVVPDDEAEHFQMSVVAADPLRELRNMFSLLLANPVIRFRPPPGHELTSPWNAPSDYEAWDAWVRECMGALLADPRDREALVSFIG